MIIKNIFIFCSTIEIFSNIFMKRGYLYIYVQRYMKILVIYYYYNIVRNAFVKMFVEYTAKYTAD